MKFIPKVSIVMTVFNHEEFVKEAIESVLSQSFKNYEFLIINDGSTDNTKQIIEIYKDYEQIKIKHIEHVGRSKALNTGFKMAKGEYITIIDSDDIYLLDKVYKQVRYLNKHPKIVMVGTYAIEQDLMKNDFYINKPPTDYKEIKKLLLNSAVLPFPTIMVRKSILEEVGFCNEKLELKIDFDLFGKIAARGNIGVIPEELVIIRRHARTTFKYFSPEKHRRTMLRVRWKNLWRLRPNALLFIRILLWLSFEYVVNLFPSRIRHRVPNIFRGFLKNAISPRECFNRPNMATTLYKSTNSKEYPRP
jgi:glycosyltransferase involved in cell wall biosynthesis